MPNRLVVDCSGSERGALGARRLSAGGATCRLIEDLQGTWSQLLSADGDLDAVVYFPRWAGRRP